MSYENIIAVLSSLDGLAGWVLFDGALPEHTSPDPSCTYHQRFGYTIGWSIHNTESLPSEEELQALHASLTEEVPQLPLELPPNE